MRGRLQLDNRRDPFAERIISMSGSPYKAELALYNKIVFAYILTCIWILQWHIHTILERVWVLDLLYKTFKNSFLIILSFSLTNLRRNSLFPLTVLSVKNSINWNGRPHDLSNSCLLYLRLLSYFTSYRAHTRAWAQRDVVMCHFDPRFHIHAKSKIPEKKTPIIKNSSISRRVEKYRFRR